MGRSVHLLQVGLRDVSVDLGGREVGVPEHLLDDPQVGAPFEEVGGEGVTKRVRVQGSTEASLENSTNVPWPEGAAPPIHEHQVTRLGSRSLGAYLQPRVDGPSTGRVQGDEAFLSALTEDS